MHQAKRSQHDDEKSSGTSSQRTEASAPVSRSTQTSTSNATSASSTSKLEALTVPDHSANKPGLFAAIGQALLKLSPKKLIATVVEAYKEFQRNRKGEEICHDKPLLQERMYSRVMATFGISEVVGPLILGPILGIAGQVLTKNPNYGTLGTVVGDYLGAIVGFAVTFYALNKKMYQASSDTMLGRLGNLWKDTKPFLVGCTAIAAGLYAMDIGIGYGISALFPNASKFIPMTGVVTAFNIAFAEAAYLLSAGTAFSGYSKGPLTDRALERYKKYPEVK